MRIGSIGRPRRRRKRTDACRACGKRWSQRGGLCRICGREAGIYDNLAEPVARAVHGGTPIAPADLQPRPARAVVVEGVEFEVMWDGA